MTVARRGTWRTTRVASVRTRSSSLLLRRPSRVELFEERRRYPFDGLHLSARKVLAPRLRRGLAVELALPLLLFRNVLPGVLLHGFGVPCLLYGDVQLAVHTLDRPQGVCPQVLVADYHLAAPMRFVGPPCAPHVLQVGVGVAPHESVRVRLGERLRTTAPFAPAPGLPTTLPGRIEPGGDNIPRVTDQEHHPTLRQGLHYQGEPGAPCTSRAEDPDHVLGSDTTGGAPVGAGRTV